jgi:hypothetical protein
MPTDTKSIGHRTHSRNDATMLTAITLSTRALGSASPLLGALYSKDLALMSVVYCGVPVVL